VPLAGLTTLRVGGPARSLLTVTTEPELLHAVKAADAAGERVLLLGGGSNLVIDDAGWDGVVVHIATHGIRHPDADVASCADATLVVAAGHSWDDLVAYAVDAGLGGIEALAGIPGSVGATPVQNVGAYGQEVSQTIAAVRTWDRGERRLRSFATSQCEFGYRDSIFKRTSRDGPGGTDRYVVLDVTFQLPLADLSLPVAYAELARRLGIEVGQRAPLREVREAVLELRRGKGMVLDEADHDTWSVGSFFTNPILDAAMAAGLPEAAPRWAAGPDRVKVSAAWLIEHSGVGKGHGLPGPAAVSTKHTLALTNRGGAGSSDVLALAREVRAAVSEAFGITLDPEPRLVGAEL